MGNVILQSVNIRDGIVFFTSNHIYITSLMCISQNKVSLVFYNVFICFISKDAPFR